MTDRKSDNNRSIGIRKLEEIGVPKAQGESWTELAQRLQSADTAPEAEDSK